MTDVLTEVVYAPRDGHDAVSKACFRIPKAVFDDPYPLDPRQDMLHGHPKLSHQMIMDPVSIRSFLTTRFLDRLIDQALQDFPECYTVLTRIRIRSVSFFRIRKPC